MSYRELVEATVIGLVFSAPILLEIFYAIHP